MENTKHTPGPWRIGKHYGHRLCIVSEKKGHEYTFVASADNMNNPNRSDVDVANAKLIAAAPDLLEAIHILLEDNGYDTTQPIEGFSARTQKVIEAIRKATT